jgi:hypothetical protein
MSAHSRWSCPEARSSDTGIKTGPCGDETDDFDGPLMATTAVGGDDDSILAISPGPMRVTFEESVHHTGAPFRISLSSESPRRSFPRCRARLYCPPIIVLRALLPHDMTNEIFREKKKRRRWK